MYDAQGVQVIVQGVADNNGLAVHMIKKHSALCFPPSNGDVPLHGSLHGGIGYAAVLGLPVSNDAGGIDEVVDKDVSSEHVRNHWKCQLFPVTFNGDHFTIEDDGLSLWCVFLVLWGWGELVTSGHSDRGATPRSRMQVEIIVK